MNRSQDVALFLLLLAIVAQTLHVMIRAQPADDTPAPAPTALIGDTVPALTGYTEDSVQTTVSLVADGRHTETVVYAFHPACAFCDTVAPEWAVHFAAKDPNAAPVRRIAVTREVPGRRPPVDAHGADLEHVDHAVAEITSVSGAARRFGVDEMSEAMSLPRTLALPAILAMASCDGPRPPDMPVIAADPQSLTVLSPTQDALWNVRDVLVANDTIWALTSSAPHVHGFGPPGEATVVLAAVS